MWVYFTYISEGMEFLTGFFFGACYALFIYRFDRLYCKTELYCKQLCNIEISDSGFKSASCYLLQITLDSAEAQTDFEIFVDNHYFPDTLLIPIASGRKKS